MFENHDIEKNILSGVLIGKLDSDNLNAEYFTNKDMRTIFEAVENLRRKGLSPDFATIRQEVVSSGHSTREGHLGEVLAQILGNTFPVSLESNLRILKDLAKRRQTAAMLREHMEKLSDMEQPVTLQNIAFAQSLDRISVDDDTQDDEITGIIERVKTDLVTSYDEREKRYLWGIPWLDQITLGLHPEELTVIAAKSSVGKTAFVLQAVQSLLNNGLRVIIISREMSDTQLFRRMLASATRIDAEKFRSKYFTNTERNIVNKEIEEMEARFRGKLFVNTRISTTAGIKKRIRETKAQVLVLDYIQLLTPSKSETSREREVAEISRQLKEMASDFEIPVVALSQLNDEMKDASPTGERVMRESKAIYQNSNNVIYLHRPGKDTLSKYIDKGKITEIQAEGITSAGNRLIELIVDKQRDGRIGKTLLEYDSKTLRFLEISKPIAETIHG